VHISTEAIRTQSRTIDVGSSVHGFLAQLGLAISGKAYNQMKQQMTALAVCNLRLGRVETRIIGGEEREFAVTLDAKPIRKFEAWLDKRGDQPSLWPTEVELTEEFFESLRETAVPLEHAALAKLTHSALALDLYTWLAHRLHRVRHGGSRISWAALQEQFGGEYGDRKDFKREMKRRLHDVMGVYPAARVEEIEGGIMLRASPPPIPKSSVLVRKIRGQE
jgi:hypothetical protein